MRNDQLIERAGPALLASLAPAVMLAVDPAGWFPFGPVKWLAVSSLVLAGAATLWTSTPMRVPRPLGLALLALVAAMAAAAAVGEDPLYAWVGTPERRFGVLGWLLCALAMAAGCSLGGPTPANHEEKVAVGAGDAGHVAGDRRDVQKKHPVGARDDRQLADDGQDGEHEGSGGGGEAGRLTGDGRTRQETTAGTGSARLLAGDGRDGRGERSQLEREPHRALPVGLTIAGLGVGAVATAEALGWEPAVLDAGSRLTGTFGSAAYLGAAAALLLPVVLGVAADRDQPATARRAAGLAGPLLAVAVLGSGARAAWVGLAVAALWTAWARRRVLLGSRRRNVALGAGATVVLTLLLVATPVGSRLGSITDPDAPGGQGRLDEWRVAVDVLAAHPVTGVGPEGYRIAFADGVDAAYERDHGREVQPDRAHSGPLDIALVGGLPGLATWLAVVVIVGAAVRRAMRWGSGWTVGVAAALVAHLVGQLFLFPVIEVEPVAWLLGGVLVASAGSAPRSAAQVVVPRLVVGVVAVLALVSLVAGTTEVVADRRAVDAADALARGEHHRSLTHVEAALDLRPDVLRLHLLAARVAVAADEGLHTGIHHLDDALELSPGDPIARRQRTELLVARAAATQVPAHADAARAELDRLLEDDPDNGILWHQAAVLADVTGDRAAFELAQAHLAELAPDDELAP